MMGFPAFDLRIGPVLKCHESQLVGRRSNKGGNTFQGPATFADWASPIFGLPSFAYSKNRRHVPSYAWTMVASLGLTIRADVSSAMPFFCKCRTSGPVASR